MSSSTRPVSPAQPSSSSVTTTTVSTSPRSTLSPGSGTGGGGGPSTTASSSVSASQFPAPPGHQLHHHHHHHHHHPHPHHHQQQHQHHPHPQTSPPHGGTAPSTTTIPSSPTNPAHLPTPAQEAQTAQARAALVASLGNTLDTELSTRAALLHANQAAIDRQERDVRAALAGLRSEDEKLMRVLGEGSRQVKELGDVQNWAERLERDFLVLEETMRLVGRDGRGSSDEGSWSGSGSGSGSWSGSEEDENEEREEVGIDRDGDGDARMADAEGQDGPGAAGPAFKGKGKEVALTVPPADAMDIEPAQIPLPPDDPAEGASAVESTQLETATQDTTKPPQSPATPNWLRRFLWKSAS